MAFHVVDNATLKAENPPPPGTSPTVRRFYSGTTDDTHSSVRRLHGLE